MFYLGSYKLTNYKNVESIPDVIHVKKQKNNGIVYVISDCLFSKENYDTTPVFDNSKKFLNSLFRQINVFNNVEAVVLNGNVLNNAFTNHGNVVITRDEFSYTFFSSLITVARNTPIYYVRGCYDCYINNNLLPVELRGVIKFCNLLKIDDIVFLHGHNNLPFITDSNCSLIRDEEDLEKQENESLLLSKELKSKVIISNSSFVTHKKDCSVITVGSFIKNGASIIDLERFDISDLIF